MTKKRGRTEYEKVLDVFHGGLAGLYDWGMRTEKDAVEVRIKRRDAGDWFCIMKRVGPDGGPQVLFAQAYDFVGALLAASKALEHGRWKEDKPWKES